MLHEVNVQPLAVVGMACRFPGGLDNLQKLWEGLRTRFQAVRDTPLERWSPDRFYSKNEVSRGKTYVRRGNFLKDDPRRFDASFFGISPRDAENMDPQQRLMLEVTWEAFENAGLKIPDFALKNVGVYVGGFMLDHMITQMAFANRSQINQYSAAGMMMTMLSNRVSHAFDFRGPSLSIDTACSSSLVAFHYACQDLWRSAAELAVVGGVNVMMRPEYPMGMCKGHFLSKDGECKSFDERGDGYGRAEGAGVVLLKPLSKAVEDGDDIWATVIGTGTNQDGHTPGISMPNGESQRALIEDVCAKYHVDPRSVQYVECHGTGTAIGDPTEARAIGETYGAPREADQRVIIGSIKSNIGHMEAGAGVAGIIKAVLTLHHGETSPLANLQKPNSAIPFNELKVQLSDQAYPLDDTAGAPRVAVNSFGYGGSNAHAILEAYQPAETPSCSCEGTLSTRPLLLPITARSPQAIQQLAQSYLQMLESGTQPRDLIGSLIRRRAHLNHRMLVLAKDGEELQQTLRSHLNGEASSRVALGQAPFQGKDDPVFVFTGMGPQWWGMGQELYASNPIYRVAVEEADRVFQRIAGFSALAEMLKDEATSEVGKTEFAQPANFLIQIGITAVLRSQGLEPAACVGHSVGELSSAYISGVLSLEDAMAVCYHRSHQQAKAKGMGSMIAVGLNLEQANALIAPTDGRVSIAAINGTTNITLAGDTDDIHDIASQLTAKNIFNRILEVEVPYHGPAMEPLMTPLAIDLLGIKPQAPSIPLYSTVTGQRVEGIAYGADYWPKNIRQPVEFVQAIESIIQDGYRIFVEIGPHPVLATSIKECIQKSGKDCRQTFTLRRKTAEVPALERTLLETYVNGGKLAWNHFATHHQTVDLPNYPWQREFLWLENPRAEQDRVNPIVNPILGTQEAPGTYSYRNDFDHEAVEYLRDHQVMGLPILPGAGYVESFLELAALHFPEAQAMAIRNFEIFAPLILKDDRGLDFVTTLDPAHASAVARSLENGKLGFGQLHAKADLAELPLVAPPSSRLEDLQARIHHRLEVESFYTQLQHAGLAYRTAFRTIQEISKSEDSKETLARIALSPDVHLHQDCYRLHPSLLDGCFQTLMAMIDLKSSTYLPTRIDEVRLYSQQMPNEVWCHGQVQELNSRFVECHLTLLDQNGQILVEVRKLRANAAGKRERVDKWGDPVKLQLMEYHWQLGERLSEPKRLGSWLVLGDQMEFSDLIVEHLQNYGAQVVAHVHDGDAWSQDGIHFQVPRESANDWSKTLAQLEEIDGVLIASSLDAWPQSDDPTGEWQLRKIVTALQALFQAKQCGTPRIYLLTQGAFQVAAQDGEVNPAQSSLNGFARVAFNELESGRFTSIDLPTVIDEESFSALIQELLCDADADEVAIRDGQRLSSELGLTEALTCDQSLVAFVDDENPIAIRPSNSDRDVGTVRVLSHPLQPLGADQVRFCIEKATLPMDFIQGDPDQITERPWMEFVGRVVAKGSHVEEFPTGSRWCGFCRAEAMSHLDLSIGEFMCQPIANDDNGSAMVAGLGMAVRLEVALERLTLNKGEVALIGISPLGLLLAEKLVEQGIQVIFAAANADEALDAPANSRVEVIDALTLDRLVREESAGKGFALMAVEPQAWHKNWGWSHLAFGGAIVDCSDHATVWDVPNRVGSVIKTAIPLIVHQTGLMRLALERAIASIRLQSPERASFMDISLSDLAWQKLPFQKSFGSLVISMETKDTELPVIQRDEFRFNSRGTFLITGGLGGFGQETARWLINNGVTSLVLTGRRGADTPDKQAFVEELKQLGVAVEAVACDASDRTQVRNLLSRIASEMLPLKGIVHSAAAIVDQPIQEIQLQDLSTVMRNKAQAAWILHEETRDLPLEHFILYSSAANLVGNSRQSIYSAANGFLNGLAHLRRQSGLPALSLNWGAIADVGIVARDEKLEQFLRYVGLRGLESKEGLEYLKLAVGRSVTQVGILLVRSWAEWGRFEVRAGQSPRYQKLIASDSDGMDMEARSALIAELSLLEPQEQFEVLVTLITEVLATILKIDASQVHRSRPIHELGVDSLMATEIQANLEAKLGLQVAVLELLGDSTISTLAKNSLASLQLTSAESVL